MSTVPRPASPFNLAGPSLADLSSANGDYRCRGSAHFDESTLILGSETPPDDVERVLAEMAVDQAIQTADDAHRGELAQAHARAKELVGVAKVQIGRQLTRDDQGGRPKDTSHWFCVIAGGCVGFGPSANAAVDDALAALDKRAGIASIFGGYRIPGVVFVGGFPHRSRAEALDVIRRIAIEPAYLKGALEFLMPGVVGEQDRRIALAA